MFILKWLEEFWSGAPLKQDLIQRITGSFGRYQFYLCALLFLCKFAIGYHQMAIIFHAPRVSYICLDVDPESGEDSGGAISQLNQCPCNKPDYNRSVFSNSMIMEFNLICDRKWLASFTQTIFQSGTLVGSIIFGMASDSFGRVKPFLAACVIQVIFGILAAYAKTYEMFAFFRFIVGVSVGGTMVVSFVIIMEFIGPDYREVISAIYQLPFNLGCVTLPIFAYYFRDYKDFQLAISLPELVFVIYFFTIPETPRWLIAMKKTERAIAILETVARTNNRPTETVRADVLAYQAAAEKHTLRKGTITDLFRTPNIRKNSLAMAFNWLTCSYVFYGVSQYVGQLSGDLFINVACSASVTALGTVASIPIMKVMGRKTIIMVCHIICSSCLFILAFAPESMVTIVCASIGTVTSFIVFVVVYLYCGEMFPTVVRNAAVGFSSMSARIGSMMAPFVIETKDRAPWMPAVGFALMPLLAFFITMLLPETKGCELVTTIEEGEEMFSKKATEKK